MNPSVLEIVATTTPSGSALPSSTVGTVNVPDGIPEAIRTKYVVSATKSAPVRPTRSAADTSTVKSAFATGSAVIVNTASDPSVTCADGPAIASSVAAVFALNGTVAVTDDPSSYLLSLLAPIVTTALPRVVATPARVITRPVATPLVPIMNVAGSIVRLFATPSTAVRFTSMSDVGSGSAVTVNVKSAPGTTFM